MKAPRALPPCLLALAACTRTIDVGSSGDAGAGTLRAALGAAAADARIRTITVRRGLSPIVLESPLAWRGSQPLEIDGRGIVLDASRLTDSALAPGNGALVVSPGGDFVVRDLTVRGAGGSGIIVLVQASASGELAVTLDRVTLEGNGHHGVLVNDQAGYFGDPFTEDSAGSAAAVRVVVRDSRFLRNGSGGLDYDGLRVNEGGPGTLSVVIAGSHAEGNGGDGIELDERGDGDAEVEIDDTAALANGFYSTEDLDDGIDVDEYGLGDLRARLGGVTASRNAQKGVDLTEDGPGERLVTSDRVIAEGNPDD